jgi:hypothetical protein
VKVRFRGGRGCRLNVIALPRIGGYSFGIVHATRMGRTGANAVIKTSNFSKDAVNRPLAAGMRPHGGTPARGGDAAARGGEI